MQCVILAGGKGARMKPLTESVPKSLLPVGPHPFLKYQMDWLSGHGVSEVVLCIGYLGEKIRAYAQDGAAWGLPIRYADEGTSLRGTAGALRLALDLGCLDDAFLITYGDSFLPIDFSEVWRRAQNRTEPALMTLIQNDNRWDRSNACFQNGKVTLYDKRADAQNPEMRYIDYGLSAMRRSVIETMMAPSEKGDLADIYKTLSRRGDLAGYEVHSRFYEIGSPQGMSDFSRYLRLE